MPGNSVKGLRIQSKRLNDLRNDKLHQCLTNQQTVICMIEINPQAPVAQKFADEVVFRRFQGEGVEFFYSDLPDSTLRFLMRIFWKIPI